MHRKLSCFRDPGLVCGGCIEYLLAGSCHATFRGGQIEYVETSFWMCCTGSHLHVLHIGAGRIAVSSGGLKGR
jgi:hypothetical protein